MLGSEVELLLKEKKIGYIASDIEIDITRMEELKGFLWNNRLRGNDMQGMDIRRNDSDEENFHLQSNDEQKDSINYIINCSGYTNVDRAETEKELAFKINGDGVKNISLIAKELDALLIHISTDYVFDGKKKEPYNEDDKTNSLSVYGKSKLKGEEYIKEILDKYFIIRTAWLYGKYGKNFVYTMLNLFNEREEVKVVADQYGSPTYTKDLAETILMIIEKGLSEYGIYHFTNEGATTWYEFARAIYRVGREVGVVTKETSILPLTSEEYPTPAIRPKYSILDKSKIKALLGINIRKWEEALREFLNLLKED